MSHIGARAGHSGSTNFQVEPCRFDEIPEIRIAGEQADPSIQTTLRDQRISQPRLAALAQHFCSQFSSSTPVALCNLDCRELRQGFRHLLVNLWVAQQLRQHRRHHQHLPVNQCSIEKLHVLASSAFQKCHPSAGVRRNHRSVFNSAALLLNLTVPRISRSRAYVREAATSCNPVRIVWVMPSPLASWACSSSFSGNSTVILREVFTRSEYHT